MESNISPAYVPAAAALDVTTLLATPGSSLNVEGRKTGGIIKVPTLVGKTVVQVYIEALADLDEPALEITDIKHNVNLTGCEFLPIDGAKSGKLILSGFVRENIDYVSAKAAEDGNVSVGGRRVGMNIPFKCFTKIQLDSEPEVSITNNLIKPEENAPYAKGLYYSTSSEDLSYEVAETKIRQVNVQRNTANVTINNYDEPVFSSLKINMAVDIAILIMQNQLVAISSSGKSSSNSSDGSSDSGDGSSSSGGNSKGGNSSSSSSGKSGKGGNSGKNGGKNNSKSDKGKNNDNKKNGNKSSKYGWMKNFTPYTKMFR